MDESGQSLKQRDGRIRLGAERNKKMAETERIDVNINGDESGAGTNQVQGDGGGSVNVTEDITFDDFLKIPENRAEFDRRVQESIKSAVSNAQKKWKTVTDDKVSEAEKLAQMTKEEKAEYKAEQLERELAALKKQNALNDMMKEARKMLSDEELNIPDEIISNLVGEDAENTKLTVEAFIKSFKGAVQAAVKDALKGNTPRSNQSDKGITKEQILKIEDRVERQKLMAENPELFTRR